MTITALPTRNEYTASAGQTVFTYTFKIFASTDLNVYVTPDGADPDDSTQQVTPSAVTGVGDEDGGTITISATTAGDLVTIVSDIPASRTTDYVNNGDFRPDTVNDDFDRVVSLSKQVEDFSNRTLTFQESQQGASGLTLPSPEALTLLQWKSDLTGIQNYPIVTEPLITNHVDTIAGLRAVDITDFTAGDNVIVNGYYAAGDGGGGPIRYLSTGQPALTYVDNGGSIIVPTGGDGSAAWLFNYEGIYNIKWFGSNGTNDHIEYQAALDANPSKLPVYFPADTYDFGSVDFDKDDLLMIGDGIGLSIITNLGTLGVDSSSDDGVIDIRKITFNTGPILNGTIRIKAGVIDRINIKECRFFNCKDTLTCAASTTIKSVRIENNEFENDTAFDFCESITLEDVSLIEDVFIKNNTFKNIVSNDEHSRTLFIGGEHLFVTTPLEPVSGSRVIVTENTFDGCGDNNVYVTEPDDPSKNITIEGFDCVISNNIMVNGVSSTGIYSKGTRHVVEGNTFFNMPFGFISLGPVSEFGGSDTMNTKRIISNNTGYNEASLNELFFQCRLVGTGIVSNNFFHASADCLLAHPFSGNSDERVIIQGNTFITRFDPATDVNSGVCIDIADGQSNITIDNNICESAGDTFLNAFTVTEDNSGTCRITNNNIITQAAGTIKFFDHLVFSNNTVRCDNSLGFLSAKEKIEITNNDFTLDINNTDTIFFGIVIEPTGTSTANLDFENNRVTTSSTNIPTHIGLSSDGNNWDVVNFNNNHFTGSVTTRAVDLRTAATSKFNFNGNTISSGSPLGILFRGASVTDITMRDNNIDSAVGMDQNSITITNAFITHNMFLGATAFIQNAWTATKDVTSRNFGVDI